MIQITASWIPFHTKIIFFRLRLHFEINQIFENLSNINKINNQFSNELIDKWIIIIL